MSTSAPLVQRWVRVTDPDGRRRLVATWVRVSERLPDTPPVAVQPLKAA